MQFLIHCGRHKTGSSSFQRLLSDHYDELLSFGILYPRSGRSTNNIQHIGISELFTSRPKDWQEKLSLMCDNIRKEISIENRIKTIIISAEDLSNCKNSDLDQIKEIFSLLGIVKFIIVSRSYHESALSATKHHISITLPVGTSSLSRIYSNYKSAHRNIDSLFMTREDSISCSYLADDSITPLLNTLKHCDDESQVGWNEFAHLISGKKRSYFVNRNGSRLAPDIRFLMFCFCAEYFPNEVENIETYWRRTLKVCQDADISMIPEVLQNQVDVGVYLDIHCHSKKIARQYLDHYLPEKLRRTLEHAIKEIPD